MTRIAILRKRDCCGCGACCAACPQQCIAMERDAEGFDYPRVDESACADCGRCREVCPLLAPAHTLLAPVDAKAFAAWNLDPTIRAQSASGGVFSVLAEHVLSHGGVVYGAAFDETFRHVRHVRVTAPEGLAVLRGSKYVQSSAVGALRQAREDLAGGRQVLFSGTPCQIAALRQLAGHDTGALIACDLICHGVPSPGVFEAYMREQEDAAGFPTKDYRFRDKKRGWNFPGVRRISANRRVVYRMNWRDAFAHGFYLGVFLRPACHVCPFTNARRVADLTLGDYWGVGTRYPQYDDNGGTSLVLVNSAAGEALLTACAGKLFCAPCDLKHAVAHNVRLCRPAEQPKSRTAFFQAFEQGAFGPAARVYMRRGNLLKRIAIVFVKRMLWRVRHWTAGSKDAAA